MRNRKRLGPGARKGAAAGERFQLGPFWLWYRADRDDWSICWLEARTTRRRSTGIGGGAPDSPPDAAHQALANHYLEHKAGTRAAAPEAPGEVLLGDITERWLTGHVAELAEGGRYAMSVLVLDRFWEHLRAQGRLPEPLTVSAVTSSIVDQFVAFRRGEGVSAPTISRDLAALRGPINWALRENIIAAAPRIKDVKGKEKRKELEWSIEQVAAILEAAWAAEERRHVHLFALINLSTHGRAEAILELDADTQIRDGLIYFNAPGRLQTRKRRSIVPICPTLAPWLDGMTGKVIRYRVPTSKKTRSAGGPDFYERPTADIGNAFASTLVAAHMLQPELKLARHAVDERGQKVWLPPRKKLGEVDCRPKLVAIGSPNTLRHSIHTWHQRQGVPQAQIDAAAGHSSEQGSGANYTHLRPSYLKDFIDSTEAFWAAVGEHTDVHLRYQRDTRVVSLAATKAGKRG
jgi:integrase